ASTTLTAATLPVRHPVRWKSIKRLRVPENLDRRRSLSPAKPENAKPEDLTRHGWKEGLAAFFFERLGLDSAFALAAKKRVPIHSRSVFYFLGGMALFLFGIQIITGILLALYYKPSPDQAFESVRAIV